MMNGVKFFFMILSMADIAVMNQAKLNNVREISKETPESLLLNKLYSIIVSKTANQYWLLCLKVSKIIFIWSMPKHNG